MHSKNHEKIMEKNFVKQKNKKLVQTSNSLMTVENSFCVILERNLREDMKAFSYKMPQNAPARYCSLNTAIYFHQEHCKKMDIVV